MENNSVAEALRALADSESRSGTARLRDVFHEVEAALSAGVSRSSVLETLRRKGFQLTENSFASALYRLRKESREGKIQKPKDNSTAKPSTPAASPQVFTPRESASFGERAPKTEPAKSTADTVRSRRPQIDLDDYT